MVGLIDFTLTLNYTSQIYPVDDKGDMLFSPGSSNNISNNNTIKIVCYADHLLCEDSIFVIYPQIFYSNYKVIISLTVNPEYYSIIKGFAFYADTQNPKYTKFLLSLRYVLLGLSIIGLLFYTINIFRVPWKVLTFEHRFIILLSVALVFFNDPIYAITILYSNISCAIVSTLFVTVFVSLLCFFWLIIVKRVVTEPTKPHTKLVGLWPILYSIVLFIMFSIACSFATVYARFDPGLITNYNFPAIS